MPATDGNDLLYGGKGDQILAGGAGDDTFYEYLDIQETPGNDSYDGGAGSDLVDYYGSGNLAIDLLRDGVAQATGGGGTDTLTSIENIIASFHNDVIRGSNAANYISASLGNDKLYGRGGDDGFDLDGGNKIVDGGSGTDTVSLGNATSLQNGVTISLALEGIVQRSKGFSITLKSVENLGGTRFDDHLSGNDAANILAGGYGNDWLYGGAGDDTLAGDQAFALPEWSASGKDLFKLVLTAPITSEFSGNDVLEGGLGNDRLIGGAGSDTASYAHAAGSVQADLALKTSSGADGVDTYVSIENLTGSAFADTLTGDAGANRLDGGLGNDTMAGGAGDDTYVVDSTGDTLIEQPGGGTDTVESAISWTLADNFESIVLVGTAAVNATGNDAANRLEGNSAANVLTGLGGDDVYVINQPGDTIVEAVGGGRDRVESTISYVLPDNVEDLTLLSSSNYASGPNTNGTGNALDNTIIGTTGNNVIDGKAGADTMAGGAGDDTYYVDNAGDKVVEQNDFNLKGDTVIASIENYRLPTYVERLVLADGVIAGRGNAESNTIVGNAANNVLDDGGGARGFDTMIGGAGDDTYIVHGDQGIIVERKDGGIDTALVDQGEYGRFTMAANLENAEVIAKGGTVIGNALANTITGSSAADLLEGGAGADTLIGKAGNDIIAGDAGNDVLDGGKGADKLSGGLGNDTLNGGADNDLLIAGPGRDQLTGGTGADRFVLDAFDTAKVATTITDFTHGTDTILIATALLTGALDPAAFHAGTEAATASDRVIYDAASERVWFDADGSGTASQQILIATLQPGALLDAKDISFITHAELSSPLFF